MTFTNDRADQIAAFYARNSGRMQRIVAARVNAPEQTIEDACQNAWATLVRRDDITLDHRGSTWLATVAIHEGWRLAGRANGLPRERPLGQVDAGALVDAVAAAESSTDEQALARVEDAQRSGDLRTLKTRERRDLLPPSPWLQLQRDCRGHRLQLHRCQPTARRGARAPAPPRAHACGVGSGHERDIGGANVTQSRPTGGMTIQPITYRSRIAAIATRSRFLLNEPLDQRPNSDPERIFVIFMCAYAGDVLAGVLPGPYTDDDARRFARACLLPNESEDCAGLDVEHAAQRLQIPVDALRVAHRARSSAWALCFGGLG